MSKAFVLKEFDFVQVTRWARLGFTSPARIASKMGYSPRQVWNARGRDEEFKVQFDEAMLAGHVDAEEEILSKIWMASDEGEGWAIKELAKRLAPVEAPVFRDAAPAAPAITLQVDLKDGYLEAAKLKSLADKGHIVEVPSESDA